MNFFKKTISFKTETNDWLLFKKNSIKSSTYYRYKYLIDRYILSFFKNKNIYFFLDYDFNIYIDHLSAIIATKTLKDILSIFKSILKYIERKYNIDYKLDLISSPKHEQNEIKILKDDERKKLERYCLESNSLKNIGIVMCLNTGLRLGEICALTWDNIDFDENCFIINKTIQRIYKGKNNTSILLDTPKTKKSIRKIPIPRKILSTLKTLKKANNYRGDEFFLTGNKDKYVEPRTYQRLFKRCLRICNIHDYNFHILRHTFATNCIKIGMDAKSLSELLGHSDVNITLNKYVHSSYNIQKKFLDKL